MPYCREHYIPEEQVQQESDLSDPLLALADELGVASLDDLPSDAPHSVVKPESPLTIPPMKSASWSGAMSYNQFVDTHVRLGSIDLKDLNYELEIESVVFMDGSRMPN